MDHSYAQTNVQLFNQLVADGYSQQDRELIRVTYEFAMVLFAGLYLPSGKSFIDHLVGTASILASLHIPVEIVAAGLIHAAYLHGDFGGATKGVSEAKRKQIKEILTESVEEYVEKYDQLVWTMPNIRTVHDNVDGLGPVEREVLLMRLANELEHQLDLGGMYFAESEKGQEQHQRYMKSYAPMLISMAERLGFFSLAAEMTLAFNKVLSARIPVVPWIRSKHHVAYLVVPESYRERFLVSSWRRLSRVPRVAITMLLRAKRLCVKAFRLMRDLGQASFRSP